MRNLNNILEFFTSIQGEGKYIGVLSIFIRFAKCNLHCKFCDTSYSWDEESKYNVDDVINYIINKDIKHIIITGGEPLLYQDDVIKIIKSIMEKDKIITIETNGTIEPKEDLINLMKNIGFWSVSPKSNIWKKEIFTQFNNIQFKFVIENIFQIEQIPKLNQDIIIQPNGHRKDYDVACQELAEYIIQHKYENIRVLPQFHRIIWKQRRGI